jgi:hypothetical protein
LELGEHRRADLEIRTAVEEIARTAAETRGPFEGYTEQSDGWSSTVALDVCGDPQRIVRRGQVVARLQGGQIADEVDVAAAGDTTYKLPDSLRH